VVDIRVLETSEVGRAVARRVAEALRRTPDLVLGLPTGRTPLDVYAELRRLYAAGEVDFSRATAFLIDEFVGLGNSEAGSFRRQLGEQLLSVVKFDEARIHSLGGLSDDDDAECRRYVEAIAAAGGLGLLLLGIGSNGHIGFNEPGRTLVSRTHRVTLLESTRRDNAGLFGDDLTRVPAKALSMGMATILRAEAILLIATGQHKSAVVERMIRGPLSTELPASFLQLHRHVEVYLDQAAASAL
jgi:glucosamine-6-phosphate deaminase